MSPNDIGDPERRRFLQLMAASAALAGGACSGPPPDFIVPYVDTPPDLAHAEPLFYATAYVRGGHAFGVLVENNMGRATKVEGNADHPASLGATDVYSQASVLELWDPARSRAVYAGGHIASWQAFDAAWLATLGELDRSAGRGLRILTGPVTSPTSIGQLARVRKRYPEARWHTYSPLGGAHAAAGAGLAFDAVYQTVLALDRARVIVSIDSDFLSDGPGAVRYARDFAAARHPGDARVRLYALESTPGLVGANADSRLAVPPAEIERIVWRTAARLEAAPGDVYPANRATERWEAALAKALREHAGAGVIVGGPRMSPQTHALVHRLNARLGNVGRTMRYITPPAKEGDSLEALAADMRAGLVQALVMADVNPVYDARAALGFSQALEHVPFTVHSGLYRDETAHASRWHLPQPHAYEQWSDARAYDGTATILQPVMRPLYATRSTHELFAALAGEAGQNAYAIVQGTWRGAYGGGEADFESAWREHLRRGVVQGSAHAGASVQARGDIAPPELPDAPLVAVFVPGSRVYDGRYANNAWLQELPHPLTQLVWDNAVLVSPATGRALGVKDGDLVRASVAGRSIECPVWTAPGHADGAATLPLGYGRRAAGPVGNGVGFDAYRVVNASPDETPPLALEKTGARYELVTAQVQMDTHGRDQVRSATLVEFMRNPRFATDEEIEKVPGHSLYPEFASPVYAWGMSIDLNACIGCGACTIACQAENNIAVVGKNEVKHGRELHWIRVDHYHSGTPHAPRSAFMPVPCMHCEKAPCEEVCPVGATLHDSEGLNLQVYNRCIGTRFCNQNCPYKVRRFNFLQYADRTTPELAAMRNPEVTVRRRGVMEKCTYCVQRISRARIRTENEGRRIRDGEVVTACQAVCPTRAIVFGNLNDPQSAVRRAKASPLDYTLLAELNTRPRTTYLAQVTNPDPELE